MVRLRSFGGSKMNKWRLPVLAALAVSSLPWTPVHAGVRIGVGIGVPCYRPYYGRRVYLAPAIIVAPPPPVYVVPAPGPVYVQQAAPVVVTAPAPQGLPPAPVPVTPPPPAPLPGQ